MLDVLFSMPGWFLLPLLVLALGFGAGRRATARGRSISFAILLILPAVPFLWLLATELQEHNPGGAIMLLVGLVPLLLWELSALLGFAVGRRTSRSFRAEHRA